MRTQVLRLAAHLCHDYQALSLEGGVFLDVLIGFRYRTFN